MSFAELATPATSHGKRRAALLVHALAPSDRAWLVAQLSEQDQAHMDTLLGELTSLGIPSDPLLLKQALSESPKKAAAATGRDPRLTAEQPLRRPEPTVADPASPQSDVEFFSQLDASGIAIVAALFRREPATLAAQCLRVQVWPWQQAVLDQLNPVQRRRLQDELERPAPLLPPAALTNALLRHLRRRCDQARDNAGQSQEAAMPTQDRRNPGGSGWLRQWHGRLRGFRT